MVKVLFVTEKSFKDEAKRTNVSYVELTLIDEEAKSVGRTKVYKNENYTDFSVGEEVLLSGYIKYDGSLGIRVEHKNKTK